MFNFGYQTKNQTTQKYAILDNRDTTKRGKKKTMDPNTLKTLAVNQLTALSSMARETGNEELEQQLKLFIMSLGEEATIPPAVETPASNFTHTQDTEPTYSGYDADDDEYYDDEDEDDYFEMELPVPEGFRDRDHFERFVEEQPEAGKTTTDHETGEEIPVYPDTVSGVIPDGEGGYTEVGNMDEAFNTVSRFFDASHVEYDEDYEDGEELYANEPDDVDTINIKLTRSQGEELTADDVRNRILTHPQTQPMLNIFGNDYRVLRTEDPSVKVLSFNIDKDNERSHKMAQMMTNGNLVKFGGRIVFPGIGQVVSEPIIR